MQPTWEPAGPAEGKLVEFSSALPGGCAKHLLVEGPDLRSLPPPGMPVLESQSLLG